MVLSPVNLLSVPGPVASPVTVGPGSLTARRRGRPPAAARPPEDDANRVEAVERALSILDAFTPQLPHQTLAELAGKTGLYPSTILRLAGSLARFGYLHRGPEGKFRLGPAPLRLGAVYRETFHLADYVRPILIRLVERTGETGGFYVREGGRRICLYRHHAPRLLRYHVEEGAELPLHLGASGHVLMAFTTPLNDRHRETFAQGHAVSYGERDGESAAIAAPVFGPDGFAGALGITGSLRRFAGTDITPFIAATRELAQELSTQLGAPLPVPHPERNPN